MHLEIRNLPIKPYVRMTQRGKWSSPQAQEYLASKAMLASKINEQMNLHGLDMLPARTPLWIAIVYVAPREQGHKADLDNICKAVADSGNKIIYPDDRWIDNITIRRLFGSPYLTIDCDAMENNPTNVFNDSERK